MVKLFEIENGAIIPTEHCDTLDTLKRLKHLIKIICKCIFIFSI